MASILKKLSGFVPTMDDTVGNLETAEVAAPKSELVTSTTPSSVQQEPALMQPWADAGDKPRAIRTDAGDQTRVRTAAAAPRPPKSEKRRAAEVTQDALRNKDGGIDGRSLRRTGRTALMSLKLRPELPEAMKLAAYEEGVSLGELMDEMWAAYQHQRQAGRGRSGRQDS